MPPPGPTTDECLTVNGVDWVATADDGTRFVITAATRLEVLVPKAYVEGRCSRHSRRRRWPCRDGPVH